MLPPNIAKSCEIPTKFDLTAVQGHPRSSILVSIESCCACDAFLLGTNSNFGRISYRFLDIDEFNSKIARFSSPILCLTPPSGGTPWDINVIYIHLKSKFSRLQFRRWHYRSIYLHSFNRCCFPNSGNQDKFRQNLTFQQSKVIQDHRSWVQSKAHMRLSISHW